MPLTPYQIITPLVALVAIGYAWSMVSRRSTTFWEASVWTLFWVLISIIAFFPDSLNTLMIITGVRERENAVFVTSIGLLFLVVFYLVIRVEKLEQRIARFTRKRALDDAGIPTHEHDT